MKVKNLKMDDSCLIVVDMVNGFIKEGVLHDRTIEKIVPRQLELIKEAKNEGKLIIFIKDTHTEESVEFERFSNTTHCLRENKEGELIKRFEIFENGNDTLSIEKILQVLWKLQFLER